MQSILIQLDTDAHASTFDRVVAVDAGANHVFSYGGVTPDIVEPLVHGAMFTRKPDDLKSTAIFVGGSNTVAGEALFAKVQKTFFGPVRVSVMLDSNGSNTTAAAAVLAAAKHIPLAGTTVAVLGGTGPVGFRAAQILASEGAIVHLASRSIEKATAAANQLAALSLRGQVIPHELGSVAGKTACLQDCAVVLAAGAAGVTLLDESELAGAKSVRVAIDVNAVPPAGIAGVGVMDRGTERNGVVCYGAIGVGGSKMKIHKAAIAKLFSGNTHVLDTMAIYEIGLNLS